MFEELLGEILVAAGAVVVGAFAGWAIGTIIYTVSEKITKSSLSRMIREALWNTKEEKARRILAGVIHGAVQSVGTNYVTIDAFLDDNPNDMVKVRLETTEGVDNSVQERMSFYAY